MSSDMEQAKQDLDPKRGRKDQKLQNECYIVL